jgi:hypothetical protein
LVKSSHLCINCKKREYGSRTLAPLLLLLLPLLLWTLLMLVLIAEALARQQVHPSWLRSAVDCRVWLERSGQLPALSIAALRKNTSLVSVS